MKKLFKRNVKKIKNKNNIKKPKVKSIRNKILSGIISIVLVSMIVLGGITSYLNYKTAYDTVETTLISVADVAVIAMESQIDKMYLVAEDLGRTAILTDENVSSDEKAWFFISTIGKHNYMDAYIADKSGKATTTLGNKNIDVSGEEYFKVALTGGTFISDPLFNQNGEMYFAVSAPLWKNGKYNTSIEGVVVTEVYGSVLSDFVSEIEVGEGGFGFILDKDGYTIAHPEYERVLGRENSIQASQTDSTFEELSNIETDMKSGKVNFGSYEMNGVSKLIAYSPMKGTNGWGMLINTPELQYMDNTIYSVILTAALVLIVIIVALIIGTMLSNRIAKPIMACANRLKMLSEGDLNSEVPKSTSNDETGVLLESLDKTVGILKDVINDISYHLGTIVKGDFTTDVNMDYYGDLSPIKESLIKLIDYNNYQMRLIGESAEQIASGSEQVAAGAQVLSQGATEQASSVEELAATITEMAEQIKATADNAAKGKQYAVESGKEIEIGNKKVEEMNVAMNDISNSSREIAKIIKVIDDIAFQTNILSLNAAVEAARAGSAGKGFAVVADEVKNLASKSAEAAKSTTAMIENSLKSVEIGSKIASDTKESLRLINEKAFNTNKAIEEIAAASEEEALAANQITAGIDQISSVVQTNSATSEESAAASEELSSQAQLLKGLIDGIKLKETSGTI